MECSVCRRTGSRRLARGSRLLECASKSESMMNTHAHKGCSNTGHALTRTVLSQSQRSCVVSSGAQYGPKFRLRFFDSMSLRMRCAHRTWCTPNSRNERSFRSLHA